MARVSAGTASTMDRQIPLGQRSRQRVDRKGGGNVGAATEEGIPKSGPGDSPTDDMADQMGSETTERLATGYSGRLFLVLSVGWIGIEVSRGVLPPLLPTIIDDLAITPFEAGAVLTVLWATYALTHYPGGRLADRLSRKTVLVTGLLAIAGGLVLLAAALSYPLLLLGVSVMGAAGGLYSVSTRAKTADLYVARRAQAFGIQMSFARLGGAVAAGVAVAVLAVGTWRSAFLPIAVFMVLVALALHRWLREPYVFERIDMGVFETGRRVFGKSSIRYVLVAYVLWTFAMQGVIGFLPTFLLIEKGFSTALASGGFAVVYVVGVVAGPLAGVVGDRHDKVLTAAAAIVLATVGLAAMVWADSSTIIILCIVLFALGIWSFPPVMQATLMDIFDDVSMGGDFGAAKTVWAMLGSLGPSYVGYVAGGWTYGLAFLGLVGTLVLCLGLLGVIWRLTR